MRNLLDKYLQPLRAPDEPAAPPAAPPASPPAAPGGGGNQPPAAPPVTPPATPPAGDPAPAAGPYRPQGLPETMFGDDDKGTIDKMKTALDGYRTRDSERGVPDKPDAYIAIDAKKLVGDMKLDAAVEPYLAELAKDPLMKAAADIALAEKIPVGAMQKLVGTLFAEAHKAGILEPLVDPAKERAALLPDSAKSLPKDKQDAAIEARLKANEDFVKVLTKPGADGKALLDPKVGENALLMLMDTAQGNQFLEFFREQMTGAGKAAVLAGGVSAGAAAGTREALRERAALPVNTVGHREFKEASWKQLQEDYKKLSGD